MDWIKQRSWQLGIAALLVLGGALVIYLMGSEEGSGQTVYWVGLALIFLGLLVPLGQKLVGAFVEEECDERNC